jgi:hypothetical protein
MKTILTIIMCSLSTTAAVGLTPTQSATPSPTPTTAACELVPAPASGPPGTQVQLSGPCGRILYHRLVSIYFDRMLMVQFDGPGPQYSTGFVVPHRARPGLHTLTMESGPIPFGEVTALFEVTGEPLPCSGDCNGDELVGVDELVTGVGITLGAQTTDSCPPFDVNDDDAVAVNELVLGVDAAMRGCDPEPGCHNLHECEAGARCLAPGEFGGCGYCQPFEGDCERDSDCEDGSICTPVKPEACPCNEVRVCQPGCLTAADCELGEECTDAGRCRPQRCPPASCPPLFSCRPIEGRGNGCVRQFCAQDLHCDQGFCVNGACYDTLGTCALPVP